MGERQFLGLMPDGERIYAQEFELGPSGLDDDDPESTDQVDTGSDDGTEYDPDIGTMDLGATTPTLKSNSTPIFRVWGAFRFNNGPFPARYDTILAAYISFYCVSTSFDDPTMDIYAEDAASPATLTTDAFNLSGRTRTTASVPWVTTGVLTGWVNSPSLVTVIQELVNDYTPTAIMLICKPRSTPNKSFQIRAQEYAGNVYGAKLYIQWKTCSSALQVGATADDACEISGVMHLDHTYADIYAANHFGARFTGSLPEKGDTVMTAVLSLYAATAWGVGDVDIYADDVANPPTFTTGANNISNRTKTTAKVDWAGALVEGWNALPSLVSIVQELVDSYDGVSLDAIVLLLFGMSASTSEVSTWDSGDHSLGPKLALTWVEGVHSRDATDAAALTETLLCEKEKVLSDTCSVGVESIEQGVLLTLSGGANDGDETLSDGTVSNDQALVMVMGATSTPYHYWSAFRFPVVAFPSYLQTLTQAYIKPYVYTSDGMWADIYAEKATAPAVIAEETHNIYNRPRTTAKTAWENLSIPDGWVDSPNFKAAIQELMDYQLAPTAIMVIVAGKLTVSGSPATYLYAIEQGAGQYAAQLYVQWEVAPAKAVDESIVLSESLLLTRIVSLELQVDTSSDDAYQLESDGDCWIAEDFNKVVASAAQSRHWTAHRFHNALLPARGATVLEAYLTIYGYQADYDSMNADIYADDRASPPTIAITWHDISDRPLTSEATKVPWVQSNLGSPGWFQSASLVNLLQELVTDYHITAIVLIFKPRDTYAEFWSRSQDYDDHSYGAKLHLKYEQVGLVIPATAALAGSGTVTAVGARRVKAASVLAGSGAVVVVGERLVKAEASLSGSGTLTSAASTVRIHSGQATLAGEGAVAAVGAQTLRGIAALVGAGVATAVAGLALAAAAILAGSGTASASSSVQRPAAAALSASGAATAASGVTRPASSVLSGAGAANATGVRTMQAQAAPAGAGSVTVVGLITRNVAAVISAEGTVAAAGFVTRSGAAAFAGAATLDAVGQLGAVGQAALEGTGAAAASGVRTRPAAVSIEGYGSLAASAGQMVWVGAAAVAGEGALEVRSEVGSERIGRAALSGVGTIAAAGRAYEKACDDQVEVSSDDAYEDSNGVVELSTYSIYLGSDGVTAQPWCGLRFNNGPFPVKDSLVQAAYLELCISNGLFDDADLEIYAEDVADPATFTAGDYSISSRARTSEGTKVAWVADGLGPTWTWVQSPPLTALIQELVNKYDLATAANAAIVLILEANTGISKEVDFFAQDYIDNHTLGAKLHLEWTEPVVGQAAPAGVGSVSASGARTRSVASTVGGSGSLVPVGYVTRSAGAALAAEGSLTAAGIIAVKLAEAALAGSGAISAAGLATRNASVGLEGVSGLTAAGHVTRATASALSADGTATVAAQAARSTGASIEGSGAVLVVGRVTRPSGAALGGSGATSTVGNAIWACGASIGCAGAVMASGRLAAVGQAPLTGSGSAAASGVRTRPAAAILEGYGSLAASAGQMAWVAVAVVAGQGALGARSEVGSERIGRAALAGEGTVTGTATQIHIVSKAVVGEGALTAAGHVTRATSAVLGAEGAAIIAARVTRATGAALEGLGSLVPAGHVTRPAGAPLGGSGAVSAAGLVTRFAMASIAGEGALTASGQVVWAGVAVLAGAGAVAALAERHVAGAASLDGQGAVGAGGHITKFSTAALSASGALSAGSGHVIRGGTAALGAYSSLYIQAELGPERLARANLSGSSLLAADSAQLRYLTPGSVQISCGEDVGAEAAKSIDDDLDHYWRHSVTEYHWIIYDLTVQRRISKIRIYQSAVPAERWGR